MAARLIWSTEAVEDIDGIAEFIARDSVYHAQRVASEIFALAEKAAENPEGGRVVPELGDTSIRECFIYSYRILYEIHDDGQTIKMIAVLHGKRLLESVENRFT